MELVPQLPRLTQMDPIAQVMGLLWARPYLLYHVVVASGMAGRMIEGCRYHQAPFNCSLLTATLTLRRTSARWPLLMPLHSLISAVPWQVRRTQRTICRNVMPKQLKSGGEHGILVLTPI